MFQKVARHHHINRMKWEIDGVGCPPRQKLNVGHTKTSHFRIDVEGVFADSLYLVNEVAISGPDIQNDRIRWDEVLKVLADGFPYFAAATLWRISGIDARY